MTPDSRRRLDASIATHENGWTTGATENPDGTFGAWAVETTRPGRSPPPTSKMTRRTPCHGMAFSFSGSDAMARLVAPI